MDYFYNVHGVRAQLCMDGHEELVKKLNVDYGWFLSTETEGTVDVKLFVNRKTDSDINLIKSICGNHIGIDKNEFYFNGEHTEDERFYEDDFRPYFTTSIYYCLFMKSRDVMIHSSSVNFKNKVLVFIGDSGCGKSSLALRCVLDGASYFSNDVLYLNLKNNKIVAKALPQELNIGSQAYDWFSDNIDNFTDLCEEKFIEFLHKSTKRCILPQTIKKDSILEGDVSHVIFPEPMLNSKEPIMEEISLSLAIRKSYPQIFPMYKIGYYPDIGGLDLVNTLNDMFVGDNEVKFYCLYWCSDHNKNLDLIKKVCKIDM